MKPIKTALLALPLLAAGCNRDSGTAKIRPLEAGSVRVEDAFWSPRYEKWEHVTVGDMLDKFEGNDPAHFACGVDAFENFDLVASGARDIGRHAGPPWYDGLVYETIRGISDLLAQRPDPVLKARVDGYIARIEAAQKSDPDGFVGTNTQLTEDNHRWGANGGFLRMQHDVYNAGMLIEAGVHYYQATGDDRLLKVATRLADYMVRTMGPAPKKNIVPAHSGPEEALVKLYKLYRDRPGLRAQGDFSDNSPGWKFANWEMKGVPLRVEIGPKDIEAGHCVAVRRDNGEKITVALDELEARIPELLETVQQGLFDKAKRNLDEHTYAAHSLAEAKELQEKNGGFIKTMWCGDLACELEMKDKAGMSSRCIPFEQEHLDDVCPVCGKPAKCMIYWGVAY